MEFLRICAMAFLIVFSVLAALGIWMRLIMWAFPAEPSQADPPRRAESEESADAACWAAIAAAVNSAYPGLRIFRIEEIK